jgi:hypothetical protein
MRNVCSQIGKCIHFCVRHIEDNLLARLQTMEVWEMIHNENISCQQHMRESMLQSQVTENRAPGNRYSSNSNRSSEEAGWEILQIFTFRSLLYESRACLGHRHSVTSKDVANLHRRGLAQALAIPTLPLRSMFKGLGVFLLELAN